MNQTQKKGLITGIIILALVVAFGVYLSSNKSPNIAAQLVIGLGFGYVLTRSRFGFAGGVKQPFMTGDASLTTGLMIMLVLAAIGMAGFHFKAIAANQETVASLVEIVPGGGFVRPIDLFVILGGFLFGAGMVIAGGCVSGSLTDAGEGHLRAWFVIIFLAFGALIGGVLRNMFDKSSLANMKYSLYLPDKFGIVGALVITAILAFLVWYVAKRYENKRKAAGTYLSELSDYEAIEKPLPVTQAPVKLTSESFYHRFFVQRWSWLVGGILMALMFIILVATTGQPWGVTGGYQFFGYWLLSKLGIGLDHEAFAGLEKAMGAGLLGNGVFIRNFGIILGSMIAFGFAGRLKIHRLKLSSDLLVYALGGLLMGIGAMLSRGCNAGALFSGIANFSIHGWAFLVAMAVGGILFLNIFEGKTAIIPSRKKRG